MSDLAERIANAMPAMASGDRRIAVGLYRLLAKGEPVHPRQLAEALNLQKSAIQKAISHWPGVYFDDTGGVIGFWGLALSEMPHRFRVAGRTLYTWCAWDSLFIPGILGKTARVESTDPITKERITLEVTPKGVKHLEPTGTVVSFLTPDRSFDSDVIQSFCHFVHFFGSRKSGEKWVSEHKRTLLLTVDQAYELGQRTNMRNFGETLA